jgi:uncharacterized protein YcgL (UPF0745 family)
MFKQQNMNSFSSEQSLFYFHKQYEFAGHPQGLGSIFGTSSQAFFFGIYRDRPLGNYKVWDVTEETIK